MQVAHACRLGNTSPHASKQAQATHLWQAAQRPQPLVSHGRAAQPQLSQRRQRGRQAAAPCVADNCAEQAQAGEGGQRGLAVSADARHARPREIECLQRQLC